MRTIFFGFGIGLGGGWFVGLDAGVEGTQRLSWRHTPLPPFVGGQRVRAVRDGAQHQDAPGPELGLVAGTPASHPTGAAAYPPGSFFNGGFFLG